MLIIELPFPPSINHYWKHRVIGRHASIYLSDDALKFRAEVRNRIGVMVATPDRLSVSIDLFAPNKRTYDIDNRIKSILDAFTHAGVWIDDEQVDELCVKRMKIIKDGKAIVRVNKIIDK